LLMRAFLLPLLSLLIFPKNFICKDTLIFKLSAELFGERKSLKPKNLPL
jgi:hypothetical protein